TRNDVFIDQSGRATTRSPLQRYGKVDQLTCRIDFRVTGQDSIDQSRTGARHADDENGLSAGVAGFRMRCCARDLNDLVEEAFVISCYICFRCAGLLLCGSQMRERIVVAAEIFVFLGKRGIQVDGCLVVNSLLGSRIEQRVKTCKMIAVASLAPQVREIVVRFPVGLALCEAVFQFIFGTVDVTKGDQTYGQIVMSIGMRRRALHAPAKTACSVCM